LNSFKGIQTHHLDQIVGQEPGMVSPTPAAHGGDPTDRPDESPLPASDDVCDGETTCLALTPVDAAWDAGSFLPPAEPAPDGPPRTAAGAVVGDLALLVALSVVLLCFRKDIRSFTTAMVWDGVPEPKPVYKRLNGVGDLLGRGAGRRSFRLLPGSGLFACCRENAVIAFHKLPPAEVEAAARKLGFATPGELRDAVEKLPSVKDLPPI
jgi:hypothetical protein